MKSPKYSPELIVITAPSDTRFKQLVRDIEAADFIAEDCETTGLTQQDEVVGVSFCMSAERAYYCVIAHWDKVAGKLVYFQGMREATQSLLILLLDKGVIQHNAIFDCMMAESYFKVRLIDAVHTDTMVLAHLLNENAPKGLKELGSARYGDDAAEESRVMKASVAANGGKLTKACYEMYKADYMLLGKYGAKDAWITYMLFTDLVPELFEQGLDKFFYEDECMPLLKGPTYELNTVGLMVDLPRIKALEKTLEAEIAELKTFILNETQVHTKAKYPGTNKKNHFNIGSSVQLSWLLFGEMGLEFATLTKEGKNVCKALGLKLPYSIGGKNDFLARCQDNVGRVYQPEGTINGKKVRAKKFKEPWCYLEAGKKVLEKYSKKYVWIEKLLEHNKKTKLLSTYVIGIQSRIKYGVIRPSFLQTGTPSGRYASRGPNFQNLPRDDKRIKECIKPRPGKAFVGADYSQLEPRVFAFTSQDKALIEAFNSAEDFYSVIGMGVYDKYDCTPFKEGSPDAFGIKYKKLRDLSKVIALASTYGATAYQLAPTTGKSIEDTTADIEAYFERFPGVRQMMLDSHEAAKKDGQVTNYFGRLRRIPEAKKINKIYGNLGHEDLPYEARKLLNLSVNFRIQSTGASIVNRAAIRFHNLCKQAGIAAKLVLQVHDSLIAECAIADAEDVLALLQEAMENTVTLPGVPLEAVPKIGANLAEV